jgi:hypothetical protein
MRRILPVFIILLGNILMVKGQTSEASSDTLSSPSPLPSALYQEATILSPHLYNGQRYHIYDSRSKDHQFFQIEDWKQGIIEYDGQRFEAIPMLYDIVKDVVVIKYYGRSGLIQLQSERIKTFAFIDHNFIRIEENKDQGVDVTTGFYDLLYNGNTKVLARRIKQRQEQIEGNKVNVYFLPRNLFYLQKDGLYYPIHSQKVAFDLFKDQKKALKKHLRERHIKFRKDRENALIQMATQYDKLTHP